MVCEPYPRAVKLCALASERFDELTAAYYQIDNLLSLKPWKFISLVYAWCIERVDPDKLEDWIADLDDLLPWQDSNSETATDIESASFFAMQAKGG